MSKTLFTLHVALILIFINACTTDNSDQHSEINKLEESSEDALPVFLIYGELAPDGYIDGEDPITEKYGFKVKRIAGCEVSSTEMSRAHRTNKQSMREMNRKYGENWQSDFKRKTGLMLSFPMN